MKKRKESEYEIALNKARENLRIASSSKVNLQYQLMMDLKLDMKQLLNDGVSISEIFRRLKLNMSLNTFLSYAEKLEIIPKRQKRGGIEKTSESISESNVNESLQDRFTEKEIWGQVKKEFLEIHGFELIFQKDDIEKTKELASEALQILEMLPDEYRSCEGFHSIKSKMHSKMQKMLS